MFQNICGSGLFCVPLFCKNLFEYPSLRQTCPSTRHFEINMSLRHVTSTKSVRSTKSVISTQKNQKKTFSYASLCWKSGSQRIAFIKITYIILCGAFLSKWRFEWRNVEVKAKWPVCRSEGYSVIPYTTRPG